MISLQIPQWSVNLILQRKETKSKDELKKW